MGRCSWRFHPPSQPSSIELLTLTLRTLTTTHALSSTSLFIAHDLLLCTHFYLSHLRSHGHSRSLPVTHQHLNRPGVLHRLQLPAQRSITQYAQSSPGRAIRSPSAQTDSDRPSPLLRCFPGRRMYGLHDCIFGGGVGRAGTISMWKLRLSTSYVLEKSHLSCCHSSDERD
jgi:hypothetical protein